MRLWLGQPFEHDANHGELREARGDDGEGLVVRHEPAIATEPGEGSLDHPSPPDDFEACLLVGAFDDLQRDGAGGEIGFKLGAGVAAIGKDLGDEREQPAGFGDQVGRAITILHAGRDHLDAEQQSYRVDERVALDAFCLFACVVAHRISAGPPFSVAFTACVSMMAAVGEGSRPSASRHWTSRV